MDGKTLLRDLREILQETTDSTFLVDRTSYDYLYKAACEFVSRTGCLTNTQSITTVADQSEYALNPDFMRLAWKNEDNEYFIKYNDGSNDSFLTFKDYGMIVYNNETTSVSIPNNFSIKDDDTLTDRITGNVTSAGASSNGECTCTDSAAPFTNASVGDEIHNTTDDSHGVVISKTSTSALVTTLFEGTDNDWDFSSTGDAYIVVPQGRYSLHLNPPPSTAGHTITVYYVQRPTPVYSPYRTYRIKSDYSHALVLYAVWLYKYRDREPNFGDKLYVMFEGAVKKAAVDLGKSFRRCDFKVNFKKPATRSRSIR